MPFPTTHWSLLDAVKGEKTVAQRQALESLMARYYSPTYARLRRRGFDHSDAEDLVQSFFEHGLHKDLFGRADPKRGRFRNFFLTSLDHYISNALQSRRFRPLLSAEALQIQPDPNDSPEAQFIRSFATNSIRRVLSQLQDYCLAQGQALHYEIFRLRVIEPAFDGVTPPADADLAKRFELNPKQVSNLLITAKRTFRRLLRADVETYAANETDIEAEIRELMGFFPVND